jgi:hypothetical protein
VRRNNKDGMKAVPRLPGNARSAHGAPTVKDLPCKLSYGCDAVRCPSFSR